MNAWIVTWEWASDSAAVFDKVAAILNPRLSVSNVADYVEFLYVISTSSLTEQASYAKRRKNNPYQAEVDFSGHIRCGHHPWLHAQGVTDLSITRDPDSGIETLSWKTRPIYRPADGGPEKVSEGRRETYTRQRVGAVSFDEAWDRMAGAFKPDFKPERHVGEALPVTVG